MNSGTAFSLDYAGCNNGKSITWDSQKGRSETLFLQKELEGLGFLAGFAKEIGVSLDPDDVLNTAARLLYNHFQYNLAVFSFEEGYEGLTGYSPLDRPECMGAWLKIVKDYPGLRYGDISGHRLLGLAAPLVAKEGECYEVVIELSELCGEIRLYCDAETGQQASRRLLAGVADSLSIALRNAREHSRVKELSLRDSLTGLYNRRVLEEILHLEESKRNPSTLSILVIDVDDFKIVNDTYGHPAGDRVLSVIGRILTENSRKENIVARYGGEEFAVLLTGAGIDTALQVAERLRKKLGEKEFTFSGQRFRLSVSIGVAHNEGDVTHKESLFSRADQALYKAKRSGKNRVCSHEAALIDRMPEKRRRPPVRFGAGRFDAATIA